MVKLLFLNKICLFQHFLLFIMSTRAIKKLIKKDDLENLHKLSKEVDESEEEEDDFLPVNKFNLVRKLNINIY